MHWDRQSRFSSLFNPNDRPAPRSNSLLTRSSSPASSESQSDFAFAVESNRPPVTLGVCAMDVKARSKAMREILTRLVARARNTIEVKVFGDKVILDEGASSRTSFPLAHPTTSLWCRRRKLALM